MRASIQVLGNNGYVWSADVAKWLRLECGLVGAMVGGVSAFKQQNSVHGLPLELSPEEVTLALERGWGALEAPLRTGELAAALAAAAASRKRDRGATADDHHYYQEEEEEEEDVDGDLDMQDAATERQQAAEPPWRAALRDGSTLVVPSTRAEAAVANGGEAPRLGSAAAATGDATAAEGAGAVRWGFPSTQEERYRYWVFRDLHAKGYRLTGGSKFGADFLVYPGDPTLYHAQFCVRLMPYQQPLVPALLAAATRGSHQARKHLLLASVEEAEKEEEDGEGGSDACGNPAAAAPLAEPVAAAAAGGSAEAGADCECGIGQGGDGHLGADSRGVGSKGERFRIRYLTIGPVEGFG